MMVINNNLPALNAYDVVNNTSNQLQKSIQKLSTGLRINSAADDAAGLSISEKMRAQINGLDRAVSNTQDGISLIQTAEGALTETHSILQRMRELSVQAANDTLTAQDRSYIQEEVDQLRDEIDHIGNTTTFNTKKLLNGDSAALWSSDNLNTKAIVNGGLRTIDQFGQKSSAEGNYKITVEASAGTGEVQKTDIFKIKHDLDPYQVEGTNKFDGAALEEGEAHFDAVGSRTINVRLYEGENSANYMNYVIKLGHDIKDNSGLAEALNFAITGNKGGSAGGGTVVSSATTATNYNDLGDTLTATEGGTVTAANYNFTASVDTETGNLVIKSTRGNAIEITDGTSTGGVNDLTDVFGAASDSATLRTQSSSVTTGAAFTANGANYGLRLKIGGDSARNFDFEGGTVFTISDGVAKLNELFDEAYGEGNVTAEVTGTGATARIKVTSNIGAITDFNDSTTAGLTSVGASSRTFGTSTYTNATTAAGGGNYGADAMKATAIDSSLQKTDFTRELAGSKFTIALTPNDSSLTAVAAQTITVGGKDTVYDMDTLVKNINDGIEANANLNGKVSARKTKDAEGNEVVRLFSKDYAITLADTATAAEFGGVNAVFGTGMDYATVSGTTTAPKSNNGTASLTSGSGEIEDMLSLATTADVFSFKINDMDGNELAAIKLTGPFEADVDSTTGKVNKTSTETMVEELNSQLTKAGLDDFKAIIDDKTGAVSIVSGTRDFVLVNDTSNSNFKGYADLLGNATAADAEKNDELDNPIDTIGMVASKDTKLRDIDKFWDSQGNFMLEDPQTITLTQGDGKTAKVTLYQYDTIGNVVDKLNSAIANDLGQAQYIDASDTEGANKFVTFVENPEDAGQESVKGTMLIRTVVPGSSGTINFASKNEDLINALSLNTIKKAEESTYYVTVEDAHSGQIVNGIENEKIAGNVLVGRLHENVDVEFDALTGIKATWDDDAKAFVTKGTYGDDSAEGDVTYLHLSDNTMVFQIGANEGDDMGINIGDMRAHALGLDGVLVTDHDSASRSISIIDSAIDKVSTQRAKLGAYQNRLEHTATNLTTSAENLTAAESRIRDTDMAKEMMNFTKLQIMLQAGNSMLAQANQLPQNVLSLIR